MKDPHAILGVPWNADPRWIRLAYKKRAAELHPDRNPAPDAAERLKEVVEAYRFLSDPGRQFRSPEETPTATSQSSPRSAASPGYGSAATIDIREFRRQQQFRYFFEREIRPRERAVSPIWSTMRRAAAVVFAMLIIRHIVFDPYFLAFQNPETSVDEFFFTSFVAFSALLVLIPGKFAEFPIYNRSRSGRAATPPWWVVESCGWLALLSFAVLLQICRGV